jgi:SAM-dependent MidA family methyltransferase
VYHAVVPAEESMRDVLGNLLSYGDLSFRDFMDVALYHPQFGYYAGQAHPAGKAGDFVTAPSLSPAFSFAIAKLFGEFVSRCEGAVCSFVDIGAGDGSLVGSVQREFEAAKARRLKGPEAQRLKDSEAQRGEEVRFLAIDRARGTSLEDVPRDGCHFIFSNELYDAFPFARLVQRGEHLHELWVTETEGGELDWTEREAPAPYEDYFASYGIELESGQFADVSLEWEAFHRDVVHRFERALFVTFDYGHPASKLFSARARRFGTAAAYRAHRVTRDLLANAGEQDLTAHINFSDLERAGGTTLYFDRMAKFLLSIGITEHPLFAPAGDVMIDTSEALQDREDARRLILPDGIGEDLRVLVQAGGVAQEGWSFQRRLFEARKAEIDSQS